MQINVDGEPVKTISGDGTTVGLEGLDGHDVSFTMMVDQECYPYKVTMDGEDFVDEL